MTTTNTIDPPEGLCSLLEAARELGVPYYEIYNLAAAGHLRREKRGSRVYVSVSDVQALKAERAGATSIRWLDLAALPDDRLDGRDVLLWVGDHPAICSFDGAWLDAVGREVHGATHYADVAGPGGVSCQS